MENHSFVTTEEIMKRLHVSRNYVNKTILPQVEHEKDAKYRVHVNETSLRTWLKANASFSRQTILIPDEDLDEYLAMLDALNISSHVPPVNSRRDLPFRYVEPFDFWDEPLIFPDDDRFSHAESFYRAMYSCGAIKIKIGERKAMFYAPMLSAADDAEGYPDDITLPSVTMETKQGKKLLWGAELCPATDETPATAAAHKSARKQQNVFIDIKGDEIYVEAIVNLLRDTSHGYSIAPSEAEQRFQVEYSKTHKVAHIRIPNRFLDRWLHPDEWEAALNLAAGIDPSDTEREN